jgi:hypothetical protein
MNRTNLFPHINELLIDRPASRLSYFDDCRSSMSRLIPWSLLTKITINGGGIMNATQLGSILRLADHVHTLELSDMTGILPHAILYNKKNLSSIINLRVKILIKNIKMN